MYNLSKPPYNAGYLPCQEGYHSLKNYIGVNLFNNPRIGRYLSEIFEIKDFGCSDGIHVIPDGCNDIIISFDGSNIKSFVSPSISSLYNFSFNKQKWVLGMRFLPGATYSLFHNDLEYSSDCAIDIPPLLSDFKNIEDRLWACSSFTDKCNIIIDYIANKTLIDSSVQNLLNYCVNRILVTRGRLLVTHLEYETNYSIRYIRKLFNKYIGHSPKELSVIVRVQNTLQFILKNPTAKLGYVAIKFGFSDQSHMNREFNRILNTTSGRIINDNQWILKLNTNTTRAFH